MPCSVHSHVHQVLHAHTCARTPTAAHTRETGTRPGSCVASLPCWSLVGHSGSGIWLRLVSVCVGFRKQVGRAGSRCSVQVASDASLRGRRRAGELAALAPYSDFPAPPFPPHTPGQVQPPAPQRFLLLNPVFHAGATWCTEPGAGARGVWDQIHVCLHGGSAPTSRRAEAS